jgi:hypothetical protein
MTRPIIGRLYRPNSYETRRSDGTFQAYNRPLAQYEDALQRAYLDKPESPWPTAAVAVAAATALAYLTAGGWM